LIYEALQDSQPPRERIDAAYIRQLPQTGQLVLAGDPYSLGGLDAIPPWKERTTQAQAHPIKPGAKPMASEPELQHGAWTHLIRVELGITLRLERISIREARLKRRYAASNRYMAYQ